MKNKVLIGGIIALAVIILLAIFCIWAGKNVYDRLNKTDDANVSTPNNTPSSASRLPNTPAEAEKIYLAFGNPSNANDSTANNYLLVNNFMVISYNRAREIPNWAAWRVIKADMSDLERVDSFRPDDRLPNGWARVTPSDYAGSGYDRGHLCPNADRDGSPESMASTFVMTNMTPQTPDLNRGPWEKLEGYLRTLVRRDSDVYIYAGVYGEQGKLKRKVTIPTNDWKIAVAVPAGANISAVNENTRVIAVDMPNVRGIKNADWQLYRTTVKDIEQATGLQFFTTLPPNVRNALENKRDTGNE
ncbi:MAG: DNA/RNA non-specific endonuclease [Pyrinomonadaceae bacterium]